MVIMTGVVHDDVVDLVQVFRLCMAGIGMDSCCDGSIGILHVSQSIGACSRHQFDVILIRIEMR